jgi:hypothetical protein
MKGQTQAVTAVLTTGVIVGAVASAYVWGVPLIEKRQGQAEINSLESSIIDLESSIESVSSSGEGSQESVELSLGNGNVRVNSTGNYIEITAYANGAQYPIDSWELLRGSERRGLSIDSGKYAIRGSDQAGVVAAKRVSDSTSAVKYRVEFRNMQVSTPSGNALQQVDLQSAGSPRASGDVEIVAMNQGKEFDRGDQGVKIQDQALDRTRTVVDVDLR